MTSISFLATISPEWLLFYRVLGFLGIIIPIILIVLYIRRLSKTAEEKRKD